ncbi:hypothetical protein FRC08_015249 [Ceratobasidium sp. 394]|nr:hypothetical protein FRC08_015249 [Ceratobasidium sp. 394]
MAPTKAGGSKSKGKAKSKATVPAEGAPNREATREPKKKVASARKKGRKQGAKGYTDEMSTILCDLVEKLLPHGSNGWNLLAVHYNKQVPERQRTGTQLKDKMRALWSVNPIPTGNKPIDIIHRRALELKSVLRASANSLSINDDTVPDPIEDDEAGEEEEEDGEGDGEGSEDDVDEPSGESDASGPGSDDWIVPTLPEDAAPTQGSSACSVKIIEPPAKKDSPPKAPKAKAAPPSVKPEPPAASSSKPRSKPKPKQVAPFPLADPNYAKQASKSVKPEPGSTSKGKQPATIEEEEPTSSVELLDISEDTPADSNKRKAEDEGSTVVRKKPAAPVSSPAKGTATRNQETANSLVGQLIKNTDPARLQELAAAQHESTVATALAFGNQAQVTDLQRDISNLRDRHDREIRDIRDRHDREMREERDARNKAKHELAHTRSVLTFLNMFGGAGTGGALAAIGGAGLLRGAAPLALNPLPANLPPAPANPQPVAANQVQAVPVPLNNNPATTHGAYNLAEPTIACQVSEPSGSAKANNSTNI